MNLHNHFKFKNDDSIFQLFCHNKTISFDIISVLNNIIISHKKITYIISQLKMKYCR